MTLSIYFKYISINNDALEAQLADYRQALQAKVRAADEELQRGL